MASQYRLTQGVMIYRPADNTLIPPDPANRDFQDFLEWAKTNVPDPAPPPPSNAVIDQSKRSLTITQAKEAITKGDTATALTLLLQLVEGISP